MSNYDRKYGFRRSSLTRRRIWFGFLLMLAVSVAVSAAGVLDPNFGAGGKVSFRFGASSDDLGTAAAIQPDGKIVVAGTTQTT